MFRLDRPARLSKYKPPILPPPFRASLQRVEYHPGLRPLLLQEQPFIDKTAMSAWGQQRTSLYR